MTSRIARLSQIARVYGMDAVVIMPGANLQYLTGMTLHQSERIALVVIPTDGRDLLVVLPALEQPRAQQEIQSTLPIKWFPWSDDEGPVEALRRAAAGLIGRTVGVEYTTMRVLELRALEEVAGVHAIDATDTLAQLRMQKDEHELAAMREAVRIVESGLRTAIESIRVGMTERDIARVWEETMLAEGSEGHSFGTIVASGPHSANPHHTTGNRQVQAGDFIILDGGARHAGYCSDITRTVIIGEPSFQQKQLYEAVKAANAAATQAVHAGASGASIDQAARQVLQDAQFGQYFIHRTGHGLGMEIHEPPYIASTNKQRLPLGATFTIEPGAYIPGIGGVRIEDNVVLTANGADVLTTMSRELQVIQP